MSDATTPDYPTVTANGLRFAYLEAGPADGPLALLLHGYPDTAYTWDFLLPALADKGYHAVAPFMRGYHPTEVPATDPDDRTIGEDALALIDALGGGSAVLVGHDWGASAAYSAAALGADKVTKLITVGIPHPVAIKPSLRKVWAARHFFAYKMPGASKRFAKDDFAALREIYERWSPTWTPPESEFDAVRRSFANPASLECAFGYYRQLSLRPSKYLMKKLPMPTVAFAGLDDPALSVADYEGAGRMFTGAYTVETVPGGHFMHRESPAEFTNKLLAHL